MPAYPFYKSLRFRFGLVFGLLFLLFLVAIVLFLYNTVTATLTESFEGRLQSGASLALQKTETSPLVVPLPHSHEFFRLQYTAAARTDTLFSNLPVNQSYPETNGHGETTAGWYTWASREMENGGTLSVIYLLPADELNASVERLGRLLLLYVPAAFVVSLIAGYLFSGFLLSPINRIIFKAQNLDLQQDIRLLEETGTEDELHELTLALNRMLQRIRKQAEEQNAFFASASHELRTPLSVMLTELQVLQQKQRDESFRFVFAHQITEIQRLNKLVNDFLLMSQLRSGSLPVHRETIALLEAVIECMEQVRKKPYYRSQRFRLTVIPADDELSIGFDRTHLTSMVRNLLENAVKYSAPGSLIQIQGKRDKEFILLSIANESLIPVKNVEELTGEFYRQSSYQEGFGLGLWIVQQLAAMNRGSLQLTYEPPFFTAALLLKKE